MSNIDNSLQHNLITDVWGNIDTLVESVDTIPSGSHTGSVLSTIEGPVFCYIKPTRNERSYSKDLCLSVINSDYVKELINTKSFLGESDHPEDGRLNVHFPNVSHAIRDIRDDPSRGCFIATIDILDTPHGRILEVLRRYGTVLGISSRGSGSIITKNGKPYVDPQTYIFSTFDIVHYPGNIDSRLRSSSPQSVIESKVNDTDELESLTSIFKSYIKSDSGIANYDDESSIDEIVDKAIKDGDYLTLLSAKAILSHLGIAKKLLSKIENYLTHRYQPIVSSISSDNSSLVISSLSSELQNSKDEIDKLTKSIEKLSSTSNSSNTEDLESKLSDAEDIINTQSSEISNVVTENQVLSKRVEDLLESKLSLISKYESKLQTIEDTNENLSNQLVEISSTLDSVKSQNTKLLKEYASIRCSQLGLDITILNENLMSRSSSVEQVESMIESYQKGIIKSKMMSTNGIIRSDDRLPKSTKLVESNSSGLVEIVKQLRS